MSTIVQPFEIVYNSVMIAISLVMVVICFLLRKRQPLKSRAYSPFIAFCCLALYHLLTLLFRLLEKQAYAFLLIERYVTCPLYVAAFLIAYFQSTRYLYLRNLNSAKRKIQQRASSTKEDDAANSIDTAQLERRIYFFKTYTSGKMLVLLMVFSILVLLALAGLLTLLENLEQITYELGLYMWFGFTQVCLYVYMLLLFVTLISDSKTLFSRGPRYYFCNDKLYFRMEMIVWLIGLCLYSTLRLVDVIFSDLGRYGEEIMLDAPFLFCLGGLCIIATIVNLCQKPNAQAIGNLGGDPHEVLLFCLDDEQGYKCFEQYAKHEYALENLWLWRETQQWKRINNGQERHVTAIEIYNRYIRIGAKFEVNISKEQRDFIKYSLQPRNSKRSPKPAGHLSSSSTISIGNSENNTDLKEQLIQSSSPALPSFDATSIDQHSSPVLSANVQNQSFDLPEALFDSLQHSLLLNLMDTFARFMQTQEFVNFAKTVQFVNYYDEKNNFV